MEVYFKDEHLRDLVEDRALAQRRLGHTTAHLLRSRIADLLLAPCLGELRRGHPHPLTGEGGAAPEIQGYGIKIGCSARIVVRPWLQPEGADPLEADAVIVVYVGDYHDVRRGR